MRLGVLVAILGEMPALRDRICVPHEERGPSNQQRRERSEHRRGYAQKSPDSTNVRTPVA
jgi:hypothetical protein